MVCALVHLHGKIYNDNKKRSSTIYIIDIADTGGGMPAEAIAKLGEPFYSTKSDGTGLGLTVCFTIVQQYNGKIHVQSDVGKGTTFSIYLPAQS